MVKECADVVRGYDKNGADGYLCLFKFCPYMHATDDDLYCPVTRAFEKKEE
jgi:hypothetical protein